MTRTVTVLLAAAIGVLLTAQPAAAKGSTWDRAGTCKGSTWDRTVSACR